MSTQTFFLEVGDGSGDLLGVASDVKLAFAPNSFEGIQIPVTPEFDRPGLELPLDVDVFYRVDSGDWIATNYDPASPSFDVPITAVAPASQNVEAQLRYTDGSEITDFNGLAPIPAIQSIDLSINTNTDWDGYASSLIMQQPLDGGTTAWNYYNPDNTSEQYPGTSWTRWRIYQNAPASNPIALENGDTVTYIDGGEFDTRAITVNVAPLATANPYRYIAIYSDETDLSFGFNHAPGWQVFCKESTPESTRTGNIAYVAIENSADTYGTFMMDSSGVGIPSVSQASVNPCVADTAGKVRKSLVMFFDGYQSGDVLNWSQPTLENI